MNDEKNAAMCFVAITSNAPLLSHPLNEYENIPKKVLNDMFTWQKTTNRFISTRSKMNCNAQYFFATVQK